MKQEDEVPSGSGGMNAGAFDVNDISREPSDEQLAALMEAVAAEARRRAQAARAEYTRRLQEDMLDARRSGAGG